MPDAVDVQVLHSGPRHLTVRLSNLSDGTGEAGVIKVDKSGLEGFDGAEPTTLTVEQMSWSIKGMSVTLAWDHDTDDVIAQLGEGSGGHNYWKHGGLQDPASTGGTGDILLTTTNHAAGDTYDILMTMRLDK